MTRVEIFDGFPAVHTLGPEREGETDKQDSFHDDDTDFQMTGKVAFHADV